MVCLSFVSAGVFIDSKNRYVLAMMMTMFKSFVYQSMSIKKISACLFLFKTRIIDKQQSIVKTNT
jgi:hypothetical protein